MSSSQPSNHVLDPLDALGPKRIISILLNRVVTNSIKTLSLAKNVLARTPGPKESGLWSPILPRNGKVMVYI